MSKFTEVTNATAGSRGEECEPAEPGEIRTSPGSHLSLDDLLHAFPRLPRPADWEDHNPDYYRRQSVTVRTDCHNAVGEAVEETMPFFKIGFIVAFQRLLSVDESKKSERMKQLETLMWETITKDWGISKWDWRTSWYVVGFEPPEQD